MSVKITQPIPPNVVEIGNEITQGVVDGLMSASPSPSSANPYLTKSGGDIKVNSGFSFTSNVYPESPFLTFYVNDSTSADFGGSISGGGFNFYDNNGDLRTLDVNYYQGLTHTRGATGLSTNLSYGGITFPDNTVQTTAAVAPTFATTAQAQAGTSTTTVVSPSTLLDAKYFQGGVVMNTILWSTATSGTGASASQQNGNGRLNVAPTTATGYAVASSPIVSSSRGISFSGAYDFSKRVVFGSRIVRNVASPDTNSVWRLSIGKIQTTANIGDLTVRGLMVKVAGSGALQLLVHNGTALTTTTSSYTPSNSSAYDVVIVSDGVGNATLYVNGSSVATSTGAPTSAGASTQNGLHFEVENIATISASPQNICISNTFVQVNA